VRGASALGKLLASHPRADVRVIVVWMPVVSSDVGPPTDEVRAPLRDPRVTEWWDPSHVLSKRVNERAQLVARETGSRPEVAPGEIVWDVIIALDPGTTWQDPFPAPGWHGGNVIDVLAPVEERLRALPR
jgi:hypothetical protein